MLLAAIILSPRWAVGIDIGKFYVSIEQACVWITYKEPEHYVHKHGFVTRWRDDRQWVPVLELAPYLVLCIPLWLPLCLLAIPTTFLGRRDSKIPPHLCQHCGYDLTGNTSGRCPKCGEPVVQPDPLAGLAS